jgi:hypothetical protein
LTGTPVGTASSATNTPHNVREAAAQLEEQKSLEALKTLLRMNDMKEEGLARVGSAMLYKISTEDFITDVARVTAGGKKWLIALAAADIDTSASGNVDAGNRPIQLVFLFDDEGRLVKKFGARKPQEREFANNIKVTSLGTPENWFVWVVRYDLKNKALTYSELYLLDSEPRKVLTMHHPNEPTFAQTSDEERKGVSLLFHHGASPDLPIGTKGTAADGQLRLPQLDWIAEKKAFRGPSKITLEDKLIYEVDLDASAGFEPTDRDK